MQLLDILQGTPIPAFVIDSCHQVTHWNAACEHVTGYGADEMVGTSGHKKVFYASDRPTMADLILDGADEETLKRYYGDRWRPSPFIAGAYEAEDYFPQMGEYGEWLYFTAAPLRDYGGSTIGAIETLQIVTERRRAEEALKRQQEHLEDQVRERTMQLTGTNSRLVAEISAHCEAREQLHQAHLDLEKKAQLLEAINQELSQYAFVVSHDLRSPLRAIRNYADFLFDELQGTINDEQRLYFMGLRRALSHGEDLVGDLLDFSQISNKDIVPQRIDSGRFLRDMIQSKIMPPDTEVSIQENLPVVAGDKTLFEQVFRNLVSNAVKFNRADKKKVEIGWRPAGEGYCELFVKDNGIGIDSRYHDQVFRILQRLHTQKEFEGTGIGLAIVRKAVARMNGSVRLESAPGEGAVFYVLLPLWEPKEREEQS